MKQCKSCKPKKTWLAFAPWR